MQSGYDQILDEVMGGHPAEQIAPKLSIMPGDRRQALLCALCGMRLEIATTCRDRAETVSALLTSHCEQFVDNRPTCFVFM
ncbi:MAG: hypothetical protein LAO79_18605 [Acidobacteriia bacterium]|nr:hypothetical protein [Terriglobia bacterium]